LRAAISNLHNASSELDIEKAEAEQELKDALQKWRESNTLWTLFMGKLDSWLCSCRHMLGINTEEPHTSPAPHEGVAASVTMKKRPGQRIQPRIGHAGGIARRRRHQADLELARAFGESYGIDIMTDDNTLDNHHHNDGRMKALIRAIKRVQAVNTKLITFERGFISPEGLPERPFYRHLGVAPGRYLGYGATPLPGVYEALVFEADVAVAEHEAERMAELMDRLAEKLRA
jgi:N-acetylated-alpha-linked acidic dipeptidase